MAVNNKLKIAPPINKVVNKKSDTKIDIKNTFIPNNENVKTFEKTTINLDKEIKRKANLYVLENDEIKTLGNLIEVALEEYMK